MSGTEQNIVNSMQQLSVQPGNSGYTEKPTQVVTPAINRSQSATAKVAALKANTVHPAIATIDRLLSLGSTVQPPPPPVITRASDMDAHTVEQLQAVKELLTAQEEEAQNYRELNQDLHERLKECEAKIKKLSEQNEEYVEKEKTLSQRVAEKVKNNKQMSVVMEEYERTISSLIGEREAEAKRWNEEKATLVRERDEAASHLASMEHAFNDVHTKYERCKVIIQGYKTNEETLKRTVEENTDAIQKLEARYETLRQHAMQQLNKANAELDSVKKVHQAEILKLNAMLKKSEVHSSSLQESLAQKIKDNEELTAICDELINKRCQIDWRYVELLRNIYQMATMSVQVQTHQTRPIQLLRGVRQGDVISPKLFTNSMEDVFKTLQWDGLGINVNGECLTHLRFADDIVLMAESTYKKCCLVSMLPRCSPRSCSEVYLGQILQLGKDNFEGEITRRVQLGWATFGKLRHNASRPRCSISAFYQT